MRLLQVSLRSLLAYSIVLLLISTPVSIFAVRALLNEEVDEAIVHQADEFVTHIKRFEYLSDLETDLHVLDNLSTNIRIKPSDGKPFESKFQTVDLYDSIEFEMKPFRERSSQIMVKGKPYILSVRMSLVDNENLLESIGFVQVILMVLLVAGLFMINRSISKKIWRPFYKTLDQLKAYELDKGETVPVEKSNILEFSDLNKTVSLLSEKNRRIFLQQKEFIENASHELQTPIAIFQAKIDELMQDAALTQRQAALVHQLESNAQRMSRLNKNLLLLSQIENDQFLATDKIDLSELVTSQIEVLVAATESDPIIIKTEIEQFSIVANKTLIEVLVSNLLNNAMKFNPKGEPLRVRVQQGMFAVSNKGIPLNIDLDRMTRRFTKEGSESKGTGLGLAIVKKICDRYGFDLKYSYINSEHQFEIHFRLTS